MKAHCSSEKCFSNFEHRSLSASKGSLSSASFSLKISSSSLSLNSFLRSPKITSPRLGVINSYLGSTKAIFSTFSFYTYYISSVERIIVSSSFCYLPSFDCEYSFMKWANSILSLLFLHPSTVAARQSSPSAFSSNSILWLLFSAFASSFLLSFCVSFFYSLAAVSAVLDFWAVFCASD